MPFYLGFDSGTYPGNAVMQSLKSSTPLSFAGFYLAPSPGHKDMGWMTAGAAALKAMGWGLVPVYYGQQLPSPVVTLIEPSIGPTAGGTSVSITGSGFSYATAVRFGSKPATAMTVVSDTKITATSPAGTGTVSVTVTNPMGPSAASLLARFMYQAGVLPVPGSIPAAKNPAPQPAAAAASTLTAAQGTTDAAQAVADAGNAKLANGSVLYLDVEAVGTLPQAWMNYITAWIAGVQGSAYRPGVYCFYSSPAAQISAAVTQPIPFWIFHPANSGSVTVDANTEAAPDPGTSGFAGATVWQYKESQGTSVVVSMTWTDAVGTAHTLTPVDMDAATVPDPSNPQASVTPAVTGVAPASGPAAGGTEVTVTGSGFDATSYVSFGLANAAATVESASRITVISPAGADATPAGAGTVPVTVTTPDGTSADSENAQFTYLPVPAVTGVAPDGGLAAGGTGVIITGSDLTDATAVRFGSADATVTSGTDSQITATSPAGTGTVYVTVTTPGGTSPASADAQFSYLAVTEVAPDSGPAAGGTSVTITGSGFTSGTTAVQFGSDTAFAATVDSDSQITATSPGGSGTVPVTVTTPSGTSAASPGAQFAYVPAPAVTGVTPDSGLAAGGTRVTISGSNFTGATAVRFGSADAAGLAVRSDSEITATSPAGTGTVPVTVTTAGGTSADSADAQFSYVPMPVVTGLSPDGGLGAGGTAVTVTGTNLTGATAVRFGSAEATDLAAGSESQITVISPAGTGTVAVTVTTAGGTSADNADAEFTYLAVTGVAPDGGPEAGGTGVTITGSGFTYGTATVAFGPDTAFGAVVDSESQITATAPGGSGTVPVTVTTAAGTSADSSDTQFTYYSPPAVSSLDDNAGPQAGGVYVYISGSGFTAATAVRFGSAEATGLTIDSDTQITVISPAGSGTVYVTVTTPGGTSADSQESEYTYYPAPEITGIGPDSGPQSGGTVVGITGSNFSPPNDVIVYFRTSAAETQAEHTVETETEISAMSPASSVSGAATVIVSTIGGTASAAFTYTDDTPYDDSFDDAYDDSPYDDSYDDAPYDDSYDDAPYDDSGE